MSTVLKVNDVTMQFGGVVAVNNLSMHVDEGEIVALIGPNGAGKTTAFNCITGVYEPTNGEVWFRERLIASNHPTGKMKKLYAGENRGKYARVVVNTPDKITKMGIARTFQNIRLFKTQTVFENVLIATHLRKKSNLFTATFHLNGREERAMREESMELLKIVGLADVAGSLPQALAANGDRVSVILPLYERVKDKWGEQLHFEKWTFVRLAWRSVYCGLFSLERDGVTWYFVDNETYFRRSELYGYYDDGERFGFFSRAVTELLKSLPQKPDVVHCNDWQSALVPIYIRDEAVRDDFYKGIRTVITVHNIEYQGRYGSRTVEDLFGLDHGWFDGGTIEFGGDVNLLKGAIVTADAVTAVSPTYAQELKYAYFAHGLENVMSMNARKLHGVLNGIDMQRYDPSRDKSLAAAYSPDDLAGKKTDKAALQRVLGLQERPDTPILAMVTRLVSHKGLDLVCETLDAFMGKDVQFVVLGKGDAKYETFFEYAKQRYGGRMAVYLGYSEQLAMQIYAGADLFLMPSKSEPCGLSQMIAMRYGAVPIVRETGGLKDTVHAYEAWNGQGNGFTFANYNAGDMCHVICEAIDLYHDNKGAYAMLQQRGMTADFSWTRSAQEYRNIYKSICR